MDMKNVKPVIRNKMPLFNIEVEELYQRVVEQEADTLEEAIEIVDSKVRSQEIDLDNDDFKGTEVREYKDE